MVISDGNYAGRPSPQGDTAVRGGLQELKQRHDHHIFEAYVVGVDTNGDQGLNTKLIFRSLSVCFCGIVDGYGTHSRFYKNIHLMRSFLIG